MNPRLHNADLFLPELYTPTAAFDPDPFAVPTQAAAHDVFIPPPPTFAERTGEAVAHLNQHAPVVRLGMPSSPYMGHQTATLEVARRLRGLGYTGFFEVICTDPADLAKLQLLAPSLPAAALRPISLRQARTLQRPVGLLGGSEAPETAAADLHVDRCLVLQPLHWRMPRGIAERGSLRPIDMPSDAALHLDAPADAPQDVLRQHLRGPLWRSTRRSLSAALNALKHEDIDLQVAYGLHSAPCNTASALRLLHASTALAQGSGKPTLLLAILPAARLTGIPETGAPFQMPEESLAETALHMPYPKLQASHTALQALASGRGPHTLTLVSGPLPEPVFRMLFAQSNLPAVVEGANTTNLMRRLRRPYLSVRTNITPFPERRAGDPQAHTLTMAAHAFAFPNNEASLKQLAAVLIAAHQGPSMRAYFQAIGDRTHDDSTDMVALGLQGLHKRMKSRW